MATFLWSHRRDRDERAPSPPKLGHKKRERVENLDKTRAFDRAGALQRKLPPTHFALLATLAALVLIAFPLLGAATGAAVQPGDGLLQVQAVLFGLMTFTVAVTLAVLYAFWIPAGSAYNVDAVLGVMIDGLRREIDDRRAAIRDRSPESDDRATRPAPTSADSPTRLRGPK